MTLIGLSLMVIVVLVIFSLILESDFIGNLINIATDNTAIANGSTTTFVVESQDVIFQIDTSNLIEAGIVLIGAIIIIASIFGFQVLASGLSPASVRVYILLTGYVGIWGALSVLAFNLIYSIEIFGSIIYITLTIGYVVGVVEKISEG